MNCNIQQMIAKAIKRKKESIYQAWRKIMSIKIKGYIGGRETFLGKNDLVKCHFCDKFVIPMGFIWYHTIEQAKQFRELFGEVPENAVGKVGNKIICRSCLGDLEMLLPFKHGDDDQAEFVAYMDEIQMNCGNCNYFETQQYYANRKLVENQWINVNRPCNEIHSNIVNLK